MVGSRLIDPLDDLAAPRHEHAASDTIHGMTKASRHDAVPMGERGDHEPGHLTRTAAEPNLEGAFSDDGVDLTLIRWMLGQSPTDRLRAAQSLIDAAWALRNNSET